MNKDENNKKYSVYLLTNLINNKKYYGITSQKPETRWNNGNGYKDTTYIGKAIRKYGWDNFSHEILYSNISKCEAQLLEIKLIEENDTLNPEIGYNQQPGGNLSNLGVKLSDETRQKMSDSRKGIKNPFWGKHLSEEHRKMLSDIAKKRIGENHNMYGKHHTEETKQKLSEQRKGKNGKYIANSETVICITTNHIYESISLAEKDNIGCELKGRLNNIIHMSGKNDDEYFGLIWMKYDEYLKYSKEEIDELVKQCKYDHDYRVICLNTKEIFNSCSDALKRKNIDGYEENLRRACHTKNHIYHYDENGEPYRWMCYREYVKEFGEVA
ncbi:MAG: GIY-YIG nuclease family protein [Firmicutes bacterium]|nr:GIY-YIG nuclease family protein [Candidatus Colivicinus equi]